MDLAATPQCTVLGSRCFVGDLRTASEQIIERVRSGQGGYVCQANAHVLVTSCHDGSLRRALEQSWSINPDGWPVAWTARRLGATSAERIAGADLMTRVFEVGEPLGLTHYLFGSTPEVIQRLVTALISAHQSARIIGAVSPPFGALSAVQERDAVECIRSVQPDLVWCGLGAPKQELWMNRYASLLAPAVLIGVGAAFDFHAGTKRRAPAWMQRNGLEWAHRLWSEPGRLAGRYVRTNSEFLVRAAMDLASTRRSA
jgi:N-acetylglucosaminyldiphosphoundecaprenol N-acetyl-beta-D-mannosaminyltransferase